MRSRNATDPHAVQPERPTVRRTPAPSRPAGSRSKPASSATASIAGHVVRSRSDGAEVRRRIARAAQHLRVGRAADWVARRLGDIGVGVKWRLVDDAPVLGDFAVLPSSSFRLARRRGDGHRHDRRLLLLISSHEFGPVAMDINAGYTRRSGDGSGAPKNATLWTASFGGPSVGARSDGWPSSTAIRERLDPRVRRRSSRSWPGPRIPSKSGSP